MAINLESFYRDHWVEVEPERMGRYEAMFPGARRVCCGRRADQRARQRHPQRAGYFDGIVGEAAQLIEELQRMKTTEDV